MTGHSAWTDLAVILAYTIGPTIAYLFHGDRQPTPLDERLWNT